MATMNRAQHGDHREVAQAEYRVDLVVDPLKKHGIARLPVVGKRGQQDHQSPSAADATGRCRSRGLGT